MKGEHFSIGKALKFPIICSFIKLKVGRDIKIVRNLKYLMSFYKFWFNFWIFIYSINASVTVQNKGLKFSDQLANLKS